MRLLQTIAFSLAFLAPTPALATLPIGSVPPPVTLSGEDGARVDGQPWSSDMLKGKVHAFFYVDPDQKDVNEKMENALDEANFPKDKFASVAVINMDATWLPNAILNSALEDKQKKFPDVTYVRDFKKVLVKKWRMKDDEYDVLVFDKQGRVVYSYDGALPPQEINKMIFVIRKHLDDPT